MHYGLKVISNDPWAELFEGYRERLLLIAASDAFGRPERILRCTYKRACGRKRYCPRCGKEVQEEIILQLGHAFSKQPYWSAITLSWSYDPARAGLFWAVEKDEVGRVVRALPLSKPYRQQLRLPRLSPEEEHCNVHKTLLRLNLDTLRAIHRTGIVDGAFARYELDAKFWPAKPDALNPTGMRCSAIVHVHVTVCSQHPFTRKLARRVFDALDGAARGHGLLKRAYPNVLVSTLDSQEELNRWLRYTTKTYPLDKVYQRALQPGINLRALNERFDRFIESINQITDVRNGIRLGVLNVGSKIYVGRITHEQRLRRDRNERYRCRKMVEDEDKPQPRRAERASKWHGSAPSAAPYAASVKAKVSTRPDPPFSAPAAEMAINNSEARLEVITGNRVRLGTRSMKPTTVSPTEHHALPSALGANRIPNDIVSDAANSDPVPELHLFEVCPELLQLIRLGAHRLVAMLMGGS